jgi:hypothetical protein
LALLFVPHFSSCPNLATLKISGLLGNYVGGVHWGHAKKAPNHLEGVFCFVFPNNNWFMKEASTKLFLSPILLRAILYFIARDLQQQKNILARIGGGGKLWEVL